MTTRTNTQQTKRSLGNRPPRAFRDAGTSRSPRPCSAGKGYRAIDEARCVRLRDDTAELGVSLCERSHVSTGRTRTVSPTWSSRLLRSPHSHRREEPNKSNTTPTTDFGTSLSPPLEKTINRNASYVTRTTGKGSDRIFTCRAEPTSSRKSATASKRAGVVFAPRRRSQSPEQDSNLRFLDCSRCSSAITFRAKRTGQGLPAFRRTKGARLT